MHGLAWLGVATERQLAKDQRITDGDFKPSAGRWDQGDRFNLVAELAEEFVRQTDGARGVFSLHAVLDAHFYFVHWILRLNTPIGG
jgi:hypothetical protein